MIVGFDFDNTIINYTGLYKTIKKKNLFQKIKIEIKFLSEII